MSRRWPMKEKEEIDSVCQAVFKNVEVVMMLKLSIG